jgi:hypothetical protein
MSLSSQLTNHNSNNGNKELVTLFQSNRTGSDTWSCPIIIEVFPTPNPNLVDNNNYDSNQPITQPLSLDISSTLGHKPKRNVACKEVYTEGAFFLPPKYNSCQKDVIAEVDIYIRRACALSLVEVVANGNRKPNSGTSHNLTVRRYFCRCGIPPSKTKTKVTTHHHRTHRLADGTVCPFKFNLFYDPDSNRWFFPSTQSSPLEHKHHHQKTTLGSINFPTSDIDKHQMRTLMQLVALNFQLSQVQSWYNLAADFSLTKGQVRGLFQLFKEGRFQHPSTDGMVGPSKHASKDAYNTIADNIDGTISGGIPITQSPNQKRLKKVNEMSSTKKKIHYT